MNIIFECFIVGIILVIFGTIILKILEYLFPKLYPTKFKKNKNCYFIQLFLFITGFTIHFIGSFIEKKHFYCCNQTLDCKSYFNKN